MELKTIGQSGKTDKKKNGTKQRTEEKTPKNKAFFRAKIILDFFILGVVLYTKEGAMAAKIAYSGVSLVILGGLGITLDIQGDIFPAAFVIGILFLLLAAGVGICQFLSGLFTRRKESRHQRDVDRVLMRPMLAPLRKDMMFLRRGPEDRVHPRWYKSS